MTECDVWSWVVLGDYEGLMFDEITGGEGEFVDKEAYFRLKERFENYEQNNK